MKLQRIERFKLGALEFNSLKDARAHVENKIGKILDKTPLRMEPKQALAVMSVIIENRRELSDLLNVTVELEFDEINILDAHQS